MYYIKQVNLSCKIKRGIKMKEDFLNDPEYREQQLILEEEQMNYKELQIDINESSSEFLLWLIEHKNFDAMSLYRVIKDPNSNNNLYNTFLKEGGK